MAKKHRSPAKFLSVLISLLIMLLSMPAMASAAAPPAPGTISVSKTAQPFDTYQITDPFDAATIQPNHRKTLVTLNVGAVPLASQVDLIMTFDVSFSMNNDSLNAMKTAAKSMAASIIGANAGSRVAIVRYATRAYGYDFSAAGWDGISELDTTHGYFSSDLTAINTAIDSLVIATGDSGGTNSEGGFLTADWIMQNQGRADAGFVPSGKRAIVFMSDGVPTYRYDSEYVPLNGWSGSESSYRELNEAMEAGAAAGKNGTETNFIYTIGLVSGLDDYSKGVARLFLNNQARVNTDWEWGEPLDAQTTADPSLQFESGYYEAADATTISAIYAAITSEITQVATNGVVTDIIAPEWTLDLSSILVDGAAPAPGVVTVVGQTLTWNLGAISSTSRSLSYVISGNAPYYGIADTNDSAQLTFTHVLASPPVSSPILFPVPEAMLPAFTADDEQTTAWDTPISFDVRDNDTVLNTKVDESESYVPDFDDFYPIFDTPVFSDGTDHGDLVQAVDGSFTYTPDGSGITVGYDVTFRYYLVGIDSMLKSEPSTAVIHVTPVPDDGVLTIYKYVYDAEGFDISDSGLSFPIRVTGPSYPAGFETSIVSGTPLVLGSLKYGDYLVEELLDDSSPYVSDIPAEGLSANLNVENKYVYMYIYNTQIPAPDLAVVKVAENLTDGGPAVDDVIVNAVIDDVVRYTVTVTNTGNMVLTDAVLTDDKVAVGSAVLIDGVPAVWLDGGAGNDPYIELGTLDIGDEVVAVYDYTITAGDAAVGLRTNIATAGGTATLPSEQQLFAIRREGLTDVGTRWITASDDAMVLADEIPLSGTPALTLTKSVRNKTVGGTFGDAAGGQPGDVFEYRIVVTNSGDLALSDVLIHDDRAAVGGSVLVNGAAGAWSSGSGGKAVVNVGSLVPGASATLTYEYTSVAADEDIARTNTAIADGTVTITIPNPVPMKISSTADTAMLLVDTIPAAGESVNTSLMAGIGILAAGAAGMAILGTRRKKESDADPR